MKYLLDRLALQKNNWTNAILMALIGYACLTVCHFVMEYAKADIDALIRVPMTAIGGLTLLAAFFSFWISGYRMPLFPAKYYYPTLFGLFIAIYIIGRIMNSSHLDVWESLYLSTLILLPGLIIGRGWRQSSESTLSSNQQ